MDHAPVEPRGPVGMGAAGCDLTWTIRGASTQLLPGPSECELPSLISSYLALGLIFPTSLTSHQTPWLITSQDELPAHKPLPPPLFFLGGAGVCNVRHLGCRNQVALTRGLEQQKCAFSQFWRLKAKSRC